MTASFHRSPQPPAAFSKSRALGGDASLEASDAPAPLHLPTDKARTQSSVKRWARVCLALDRELVAAARRMAEASTLPVDELLLGAFQVLLARWSGKDDVAVLLVRRADPNAGHEQRDASSPRVWPVQTALSYPVTFGETLARVHAAVTHAIARAVRWETTALSIQTAFEVIEVGHPMAAPAAGATGQLAADCAAEISLTLRLSSFGAVAQVDFRADLFDSRTAERLLHHYRDLLRGALQAPADPVATLCFATDDERAQLLQRLNDTACAFPQALLVHQLFEQRVRSDPHATALICAGAELSYAALNHRANQLAGYLRELGVGPEVVVGICLSRSPLLLIAVVAVLKAGGAYLPLDQAFPRDRLAFMLEETAATVVLTEASLLQLVPVGRAQRLCLDTEWNLIASCDGQDLVPLGSPEQLAYVIYTSGSRGKPKGVLIPHRAAVNFLTSMQRVPGLAAQDRLLATTTFSFDPAVFELLLPLVVGATVVLASSEERLDPWRLCELLDEFAITMMTATPTTWATLIAVGWKGRPGLRALIGGEALPQKLAQELLERCAAVWNMYGPTEATVAATCWQVSDPEQGIFIGAPIANTRCIVLDRHLQLAPLGAYGELCIGGAGLARGYLKQEELTSNRFIADPYLPGSRLYRTGDLVRWRSTGVLEYAGRIDDQVKLRGFRIELGEIEAELNGCEGVQGSAAIIREDRPLDQRLVAYVVGPILGTDALRKQLASKLPWYMVPSAIVQLEAFPLTPHLKVDRAALPLPADAAQGLGTGGAKSAAMDALQRGLAAEWQEALNVGPVGLDDDFFELGGHSLLALRLLARVAARFGERLTLASFLAAPTVRAQAELIRNGLTALGVRSVVPIHAAGTRPPLFFASGWGGPTLSLRALADALGPEQPLHLLDYVGAHGPDDAAPTIEGIAAALISELRCLQPSGPYQLVGYSLGAKVVYEMAQQLRRAGERVPVLIMLDAYAPGHPILPPFFVRAFLHLKQALKLGPLRMWPYLLKYTFRLRRLLVDVQPKLYEDLADERASLLVAELNRGAQTIFHASKQYRIERCPCRMMVITADDLSEFGIGAFDSDPIAGWRQWADEVSWIGSLPCTHSHLLDTQHAARLAALIDDCLTRGSNQQRPPASKAIELSERSRAGA